VWDELFPNLTNHSEAKLWGVQSEIVSYQSVNDSKGRMKGEKKKEKRY